MAKRGSKETTVEQEVDRWLTAGVVALFRRVSLKAKLVAIAVALNNMGWAVLSEWSPSMRASDDGPSLVSLDLVPIKRASDGIGIRPDPEVLDRALNVFLNTEGEGYRLAVQQLLYFVRANAEAFQLRVPGSARAAAVENLASKYRSKELAFTEGEKNRVVVAYGHLIEALAEMFPFAEFVVHDAWNPLHSVVRIFNAEGISDRKVGDPITNLVHAELQRMAAQPGAQFRKFVSYEARARGRRVRSATIPIYEGSTLVGIVCVNINLEDLENHPDRYLKALAQVKPAASPLLDKVAPALEEKVEVLINAGLRNDFSREPR
jgi:predicted transcriptional regulator YheO